ncbi:MAG: hypothetical protein HY682_02745 [Chloroflexi bacterium]|nr:hypothetical protein [Chloroflexota bacterium]
MKNRRAIFDPDQVAYLEAAGWRAYYDQKWLRLLRLIERLGRKQFRIPLPVSLLAAYYAVRAAAAWAPLDHDEAKVRRFYEKFYRIAARYSGLKFDPATVAELELVYNRTHRQLVGNNDKTEFFEAMVKLHGALFGVSDPVARESAKYRVSANNTVDRITGKKSADVEADWTNLESDLRNCYRLIHAELTQYASGEPKTNVREGRKKGSGAA